MKIQNNVNYNSNPAFGTKLKLTGSEEWAIKLANALEGGFTALGRKDRIKIHSQMSLQSSYLPTYIATEKDAELVEKEMEKNWRGGSVRTMKMDVYDGSLKKLFDAKDTSVLDLTKPLRFVIEGAQEAKKRFVSALIGGFRAQEVPVNVPTTKKTFVAIGDDVKLLREKIDYDAEDDGLGIFNLDRTAEEFFKNAQVIHVTE